MSVNYCVFLRGVNVNGTRMKMDELRKVFLSMGFSNVKTLLATGNIILTVADDLSKADLTDKIQKKLSIYFEYEAYAIVKSAQDINDILNEVAAHEVPEGYHHYILLSNDNDLPKELLKLYTTFTHESYENLLVEEHGIYWIIQKGNTLLFEFGTKVLGKKSFKSRLTSRNMNTIKKVSNTLDKM